MSQSTADVFRRRLEEAQAETAQADAFPMVFEGFPCMVRPLDKLHFIRAGRMPEHLTLKIIAANDEGAPPPPPATVAQVVEGETFYRRSVCAVLAEPRVVESEPVPEGGYLFADLEEWAPKFPRAVYAWIMNDCPRPKEEKGEGVLSVEDLEHFPSGAGGESGVDAGDKGEGRRKAAVGTSAPDRKRTRRK